MKKFTVIGAGMAGLFAAAVLREECAVVKEAQPSLPNNHSALLRFRSSVVGDALNIPFKPVSVVKIVHSLGNPIADAVSYSLKTNGHALIRSIISASGQVEKRYIAPPNFVSRLAAKVTAPIEFGNEVKKLGSTQPVISTLPMPTLMELLGYDPAGVKFESVIGGTCNVFLKDTDLYATIYLPGKEFDAYRASITRNKLIIEYAFPNCSTEAVDRRLQSLKLEEAWRILKLFGLSPNMVDLPLPEFTLQQYAKILPIDDNARKRFILWASEHHNVYSFGRFATWRPGLLMDDLVNDIRVIQKLANGETSYDARRM